MKWKTTTPQQPTSTDAYTCGHASLLFFSTVNNTETVSFRRGGGRGGHSIWYALTLLRGTSRAVVTKSAVRLPTPVLAWGLLWLIALWGRHAYFLLIEYAPPRRSIFFRRILLFFCQVLGTEKIILKHNIRHSIYRYFDFQCCKTSTIKFGDTAVYIGKRDDGSKNAFDSKIQKTIYI